MSNETIKHEVFDERVTKVTAIAVLPTQRAIQLDLWVDTERLILTEADLLAMLSIVRRKP